MKTEDESNHNWNGQMNNSELPKKVSVLTKLATVMATKARAERLAQEQKAQLEKRREEVNSPMVEAEQKSILNQATDLDVKSKELPKRTTIAMALAQIRVLDKNRAKDKEAREEKKGEEF